MFYLCDLTVRNRTVAVRIGNGWLIDNTLWAK